MEVKAPNVQQSENKTLDNLAAGDSEVGTEVSSKTANNQLDTIMKTKKEDRRIDPKDIDYLMKEFEITKIQATNALRRYDIKEAIAYLLEH